MLTKYKVVKFLCIFTTMKIQKRNLYLTLFLGIQVLLMKWIEHNPSFVEVYYSMGIYPYISSLLRILFGWISVSIGDLFIFFAVFYSIYFIYKLVLTKFKNFFSKLLGITSFISVIYFFFYFLWGLNYYREPLSKNSRTIHILPSLSSLECNFTIFGWFKVLWILISRLIDTNC